MPKNLLQLCCVLIVTALLVTSCSFNKPNPYESIGNTQLTPSNPTPADKAVNQPNNITLGWQSSGSYFDVYLSASSNPTSNPVGKWLNITGKSVGVTLPVSGNQNFYWQVFAKTSSGGTLTAGPVWQFTTASVISPGQVGNAMYFYDNSTSLPHQVQVLFQVVDMRNIGVAGLTASDFEIYEDGQPLSVSESEITITKYPQIPIKLRTALMLDNSTSMYSEIPIIQDVAKTFIRTNIDSLQYASVYSFSESINPLQSTFANDTTLLLGAVNKLGYGVASTNFYGAVIKGASLLDDVYKVNGINADAMIIVSDGNDTQSSRTLAEAVSAAGTKRIYAVGLGRELKRDIMAEVGTAGYFEVDSTDTTYISTLNNKLKIQFEEIQKSLLTYASSFYLLTYQSPKRGNQYHQITIRIKNNQYTGDYSYILTNYSSLGFY